MSDSVEALYLAESGALFQQYRTWLSLFLRSLRPNTSGFRFPSTTRSGHLGIISPDAMTVRLCPKTGASFTISWSRHHIKRTVYDLYKLLIICGKTDLGRFEHKTRLIDLRTVDSDGSFSACFEESRQLAVKLTREAKTVEATGDTLVTNEAYDRVYQAYLDLRHLIEDNKRNLAKAKARWVTGRILTPLCFVAGVIVSPHIESAWKVLIDCIF